MRTVSFVHNDFLVCTVHLLCTVYIYAHMYSSCALWCGSINCGSALRVSVISGQRPSAFRAVAHC